MLLRALSSVELEEVQYLAWKATKIETIPTNIRRLKISNSGGKVKAIASYEIF